MGQSPYQTYEPERCKKERVTRSIHLRHWRPHFLRLPFRVVVTHILAHFTVDFGRKSTCRDSSVIRHLFGYFSSDIFRNLFLIFRRVVVNPFCKPRFYDLMLRALKVLPFNRLEHLDLSTGIQGTVHLPSNQSMMVQFSLRIYPCSFQELRNPALQDFVAEQQLQKLEHVPCLRSLTVGLKNQPWAQTLLTCAHWAPRLRCVDIGGFSDVTLLATSIQQILRARAMSLSKISWSIWVGYDQRGRHNYGMRHCFMLRKGEITRFKIFDGGYRWRFGLDPPGKYTQQSCRPDYRQLILRLGRQDYPNEVEYCGWFPTDLELSWWEFFGCHVIRDVEAEAEAKVARDANSQE